MRSSSASRGQLPAAPRQASRARHQTQGLVAKRDAEEIDPRPRGDHTRSLKGMNYLVIARS